MQIYVCECICERAPSVGRPLNRSGRPSLNPRSHKNAYKRSIVLPKMHHDTGTKLPPTINHIKITPCSSRPTFRQREHKTHARCNGIVFYAIYVHMLPKVTDTNSSVAHTYAYTNIRASVFGSLRLCAHTPEIHDNDVAGAGGESTSLSMQVPAQPQPRQQHANGSGRDAHKCLH